MIPPTISSIKIPTTHLVVLLPKKFSGASTDIWRSEVQVSLEFNFVLNIQFVKKYWQYLFVPKWGLFSKFELYLRSRMKGHTFWLEKFVHCLYFQFSKIIELFLNTTSEKCFEANNLRWCSFLDFKCIPSHLKLFHIIFFVYIVTNVLRHRRGKWQLICVILGSWIEVCNQ